MGKKFHCVIFYSAQKGTNIKKVTYFINKCKERIIQTKFSQYNNFQI